MRIGFRAKRNEFTEALFKRLQDELTQDTLVFWEATEALPDADLEVLVSIAPVAAKELDGLPKLALIQVASDGYDTVDVDAATERGIWVSASPGE